MAKKTSNPLRLEALENRWNLSTLDPLAAVAPEPVPSNTPVKVSTAAGDPGVLTAGAVVTFTYTVTNPDSPDAGGAEYDIATGSRRPTGAAGGFLDWTRVMTRQDTDPADGRGISSPQLNLSGSVRDATGAVIGLAADPGAERAAVDYFLKIEGVEGESGDAAHVLHFAVKLRGNNRGDFSPGSDPSADGAPTRDDLTSDADGADGFLNFKFYDKRVAGDPADGTAGAVITFTYTVRNTGSVDAVESRLPPG